MKRLSAILDNWPRTLLVIFIGALLVRLAFISFLEEGFYFPDSLSYTRAAGNLLVNGELGKTYERAPAYPVFLTAIQMLFGNSIFAIRFFESVIGALLAVVIAILGRRVGGAEVGALAGFLWSVYPMGVFIVGLVYPTALMAMLLACGALCMLPQPQQAFSLKGVFLGGVFWGAGALTVPIGLATIGLMTLWLLYWGGLKRIPLAGLLLLGSAVTLVPWTVRNYYVHGRVVAVDARMEDHLPRMSGSPVSRSSQNKREGKIEAILENPGPFVSRAARQFVYFWRLYPERLAMSSPKVRERYHRRDARVLTTPVFSASGLPKIISVAATIPLFVFALVGTITMWWRKGYGRELSFLWTLILSFAIGYSLFFAKMRFRVPIEPYLVILGAYGLVRTYSVFSQNRLSRLFVRTEQSTTVIQP